ncbi:MAG: XrtA/PEP-CTERM system TPR-repeat protein PrsT [Lamprobacter sp.]|uniref:XrtA/PEP-CTERM system TPR-repeat protein PrsT n=1 Tax=Lamprobacter sp. TaxID=3100796 RepID=UPI002B25748B|nr:XrtA/PEP-CTERM system TPR-repeat protein PrsT [Lamprobacter sp.]MEA3641359.1 XrtA/PEP-CTERM system TPR-repeat protein PrsT [Lamprobacter sp.]
MRRASLTSADHRLVVHNRGPLLAAALVVVTACGQTSFSAEEHVAQARQAYAEGDIRTAIIEIKNALQQDPAQAEARLLLGEYNLAIGNGVEAEAELVRAQELGADPDQLRLPLVRAWLLQGKTEEIIAATDADEALDSAQGPELLTLRGQALLTQGRADDARATLQQALELEPTNAEALLGMAWVALLEDDREASRDSLQAALDSDPESSRAWELLGDLERDANQFDAAEAAYGKAIETTNLPFTPRFKRALTRVFQQDYEGAEKDLQVLRKQSAQNPAVSYLSGLIAFYRQDYNQARTSLEETLSRDGNYMPAVFYLGATQYALENWQQASSYLNRYTGQFPNSPEANRLLALTRLRDGDSERAERALNAILQNNPEDQATLAMMSNLYLAQGRADEALHHLRKVIAMEPDSAATRAQFGLALVQEGQREEGFSELERALELAPGEGNVRLEIAMIMERLRANEYEQALTLIERLKQRDDVNPALYYNLKGLAYVAQGDFENAEAIFREGLDTVPDAKADLASNLTGILARNGRLDEARALATQYLEDYPEHLGLLSNLARLSAAKGDVEQTESLLGRAVAAHPNALEPRRGLAEIYLQTDRPDQAVAVLREVEETQGDSVQYLRLMALAALNSGDRQSAIDSLNRLQELQPESIDVPLLLSRVLASLGQRDEARAALENVLTLKPDHLEARLMSVELLTQEGQLEKASEMLAPAQQMYPDNPQVLGRAGAIAFNQGRLQDALEAFQQAAELAPDERYLAGAIAQVQQVSGDIEASVETLSNWLASHPQDQELRLMLANQLLALQRDDEAISAYRRLLEQGSENPIALNNLAWLLRKSDSAEALRLINQAIKLAPKAGTILDTKGTIQLEQGDAAAAVATLEQALELTPKNPSIRLHLAKALIASDQHAQARLQLEQLVSEHPDTSEQEEATKLLANLPQPE